MTERPRRAGRAAVGRTRWTSRPWRWRRRATFGWWGLFRGVLDEKPLNDLRLALNQDQPIGNDRFSREIEAMTGQRRELRQRGRPRKRNEEASAADARQGEFPL